MHFDLREANRVSLDVRASSKATEFQISAVQPKKERTKVFDRETFGTSYMI